MKCLDCSFVITTLRGLSVLSPILEMKNLHSSCKFCHSHMLSPLEWNPDFALHIASVVGAEPF